MKNIKRTKFNNSKIPEKIFLLRWTPQVASHYICETPPTPPPNTRPGVPLLDIKHQVSGRQVAGQTLSISGAVMWCLVRDGNLL